MTWLALLPGTAALLAAAGYFGAYLVYRSIKLSRLKPRRLEAEVQWTGRKGARRTALLVGDSRIARWPVEAWPGWRIGRLGFGGEAAVNIEPAARDQIAAAGADVVVVQAGGNDAAAAVFQRGALRDETLARARRAVIAIGEDARRAGASQAIVLTLVPPIGLEMWKRALTGSGQGELMSRLSDVIAASARVEGMAVLDANLIFRDSAGKLRREYRSDGLHWSSAGYRALNVALWDEVKTGVRSE